MRRPTVRGAVAVRVGAALAALALVAPADCGCASSMRDAGLRDPADAACPRDAARDSARRCACDEGAVSLLGACVAPTVGDAFCGPAARIGAEGCAFRGCGEGQALDLATGACVARALITEGDTACAAGTVSVVLDGRRRCVARNAACPRGTSRAPPPAPLDASPPSAAARTAPGGAGLGRDVCVGPLRCPPGSISEEDACRPIVFAGTGGAAARATPRAASSVDVGAWAVRAFGVPGGRGSPELCGPLAVRPDLFGAVRGPVAVDIRIALSAADQDITQVHAEVDARSAQPLAAPAKAVVVSAVDSLIEVLRSLGGEATAAAMEVEVRCAIGGDDPGAGAQEP